MSTPSANPSQAALGELLAVEHSAVYAVGVAGGVLDGLAGPTAFRGQQLAGGAYDAHRALRDQLISVLAAAGAPQPAAAPAYRLPIQPRDVRSALALLAAVDDRTAAAAHDALASVTGTTARALVADTLADAAVRAYEARTAAGVPASTAAPAFPGA